MSAAQPFPPRERCACGEVLADFGACAKCPDEPPEPSAAFSECRWCGHTFAGTGDDCGGCRLNDAQCYEWAKDRAAKYHADCAAAEERRAKAGGA